MIIIVIIRINSISVSTYRDIVSHCRVLFKRQRTYFPELILNNLWKWNFKCDKNEAVDCFELDRIKVIYTIIVQNIISFPYLSINLENALCTSYLLQHFHSWLFKGWHMVFDETFIFTELTECKQFSAPMFLIILVYHFDHTCFDYICNNDKKRWS